MKFEILVLLKVLNVYAINANDTTKTLFKCKGSVLDIGNTLEIPQNFMDIGKAYTFGLRTSGNEINCSTEERSQYTVNLRDSKNTRPLFTTHGILMIITESHRFFKNWKDFCIQSVDENAILTLSVCHDLCENKAKKLCIKKCCSIHKVLGYDPQDPEVASCQLPNQGHSNLDWKPMVYHDAFTKLSEDEHLAIEPNVYNSFNFYDCVSMHVLIQPHTEFSGDYNQSPKLGRFRLLTNGDLAICGGHGKWVILKDSTYCIDSLQNFGKDNNSDSGDRSTEVIIRCLDSFNLTDSNGTIINDKIGNTRHLRTVLYKILIPFSSFFLLCIIIVYCLLWDKQNVHGYTMFTYSCSLFLLYAALSAQSYLTIGTAECTFVAVSLHFFFISTFCLLTTINFDIYYTFRNLKVCTDSKNVRRYLLYLLFSVLVPTIIISIGWSLDNSDVSRRRDSCELEENEILLTPRYGQRVCGVIEEAQGWYIYFPVGILLGCNIIFFSMTIYIMHQYRQNTDAVLKGKSTKEDNPLLLFGKLFIVMGISWMLDFVGWALRHDTTVYRASVGLIYIFDAINVLQAVVIFYIFVCKKIVFDQLWQKHFWLRPLLSLCIKWDFCKTPPDKRPSLITQVSSLNGRLSRKPSTVSMKSNVSIVSEHN